MLLNSQAIKKMRWRGIQHIDRVRANLSPTEVAFSVAYDAVLREYFRKAGHGDLTLDQLPPDTATIQVLVKRDLGEVQFSFGWVNLQKGMMHMLPRSEVEHFVRDGSVEYIDDELLDLGVR